MTPPLLLKRLALAVAVFCTASGAASAQSSAPLVQQSDVTYLGAFALPQGSFGASRFGYGGRGLSFYRDKQTGARTLFMEGHEAGAVAQIQIPAQVRITSTWSDLPVATVLKPFVQFNASPDPASCVGNPSPMYGTLVYNERLILSAACSYGGFQTTTHSVASLSLSGQTPYFGFATSVLNLARALAGPMILVPPEWRASLGGPVLTGNCCIAVVSTTSAGPAATVFNPDDVGTSPAIAGRNLLFYPLDHPACGYVHCEAEQNSVYNLTAAYGGGAFPVGTRSVLFVTAQGVGPYCYGTPQECNNDTALPDVKGPHAQPYRYQMLAYDANDLLDVKLGKKQSWEPKPYAVIALNGMPFSGNNVIKGAAYDPEQSRLYITQDFGESPRVEVYYISTPTSVRPLPPENVAIR